MGRNVFSVESYKKAREDYGVTHDADVTKVAEKHAQETGHLSEIVDPAINPIRRSLIRLDPHQKKWIATSVAQWTSKLVAIPPARWVTKSTRK